MKRNCPICKKPTDSETHPDFPFCSERCRLQDLGNWSSEKYRISDPVFDESELEGIERDAPQPDSESDNQEKHGGER